MSRLPRGISKMTPIMICFGMLMFLGVWIVYDIGKKDYDTNVIRGANVPAPTRTFEVVSNPTPPQPPAHNPQPAMTAPPQVFVCRRASAPLTIDGNLTE